MEASTNSKPKDPSTVALVAHLRATADAIEAGEVAIVNQSTSSSIGGDASVAVSTRTVQQG